MGLELCPRGGWVQSSGSKDWDRVCSPSGIRGLELCPLGGCAGAKSHPTHPTPPRPPTTGWVGGFHHTHWHPPHPLAPPHLHTSPPPHLCLPFPTGELYDQIRLQGRLPESAARFYAAGGWLGLLGGRANGHLPPLLAHTAAAREPEGTWLIHPTPEMPNSPAPAGILPSSNVSDPTYLDLKFTLQRWC